MPEFRNEAGCWEYWNNIGVCGPNGPISHLVVWKDSFFGDLHGQGKHGHRFPLYPDQVIIERCRDICLENLNRIIK